jgi:hypothetical protein
VAEGRTDITECIVAFCKFADASKNSILKRQFELKGEENCILLSLTDCTLHERRLCRSSQEP